jgi:hypothetical protein
MKKINEKQRHIMSAFMSTSLRFVNSPLLTMNLSYTINTCLEDKGFGVNQGKDIRLSVDRKSIRY